MSSITSRRPSARGRSTGRPLVAVLSDGHRRHHSVTSAVVRQLTGLGVDVTLIGCDAEDSVLLEFWREPGLVIVVDPIRADPDRPARVQRYAMPRPGAGRLVVLAVETGEEADAARQVADAVTAEIRR